jgi:hypothetical protein
MPDFVNFTSLPSNQEMGFVVYEQRMAEAQSKSLTAAIVAGIAVLVLALGVYLGVAPDETDITKDMNMSNLTHAPAANNPNTVSAAPVPADQPVGSAAAPAGSASGAASGAAPASGSASGSN